MNERLVGPWSIVNEQIPVGTTPASVAQAAPAANEHLVCTNINASFMNSTFTRVLRVTDGAGNILWSHLMNTNSLPITTLVVSDLRLVAAAGQALSIGFDGVHANENQVVSASGFTSSTATLS